MFARWASEPETACPSCPRHKSLICFARQILVWYFKDIKQILSVTEDVYLLMAITCTRQAGTWFVAAPLPSPNLFITLQLEHRTSTHCVSVHRGVFLPLWSRTDSQPAQMAYS